jgi:DNA processing protein
MTKEELSSFLKLSKIKGLGEARMKKLILNFEPLCAVFDAKKEILSSLIGEKFGSLIKKMYKINVEPEIALLKKVGAKVLSIKDPYYPTNLKHLPDAPPFLYIKGEITDQDSLSIGIIGARRASYYGRMISEKFAYEFASSSITVVSGLARGVDTYAHRGSLRAGGRTIAVLGCGIDIVYPPENRELMDKICNYGACISEFPLGTQPWRGNFPTRNRLISGLSKAIVVIEASSWSGVFSTVKWALEQGREVFAVPGNITSETSRGVNQLIKDGAQIATSSQDIIEYLGIKPPSKEKKEIKLSEEEEKVWNYLSYEPIHADKLSELLSLPIAKVLEILLNLELQGIVRQLPGRSFVKNI